MNKIFPDRTSSRFPVPALRLRAALLMLFVFALYGGGAANVRAQARRSTPRRPVPARAQVIPEETLLRIVRAEDERRFDAADLGALLSDANASLRARAAHVA